MKNKLFALIVLVLGTFTISSAQKLIAFEGDNEKTGFKDAATGKVVVAPKYDFYDDFSDGLAVVNIGAEWPDDPNAPTPVGGKWGYINEKGVEVIPLKYDYTETFSDGMGVFANKGKDGNYKYGYLNTKGEAVVPAQYSFADPFENGYGKVENDKELRSFVNKEGKLLFPFKYQSADYLSNDRFSLGNEDPNGDEYDYLYALADAKGNLLTEMKYAFIGDFKDGPARATIGRGANQKKGFLDLSGKEVIRVIYSSLDDYPVNDRYRTAQLEGKWGLIDEQGKTVIPFNYETLTTYSYYEGRVLVKKGNVWGVIDMNNKVLLPIKYDGIKILSNDLNILGVEKNGKWGLMDYKGNILLEPQFEIMYDTSNKNKKAIARVKKDGKFIDIDRNGNKVE
ncbi:MAG: WG repeat-containing protein [Chitinophagaceae bacterium]|nr:WG repeat-containing protein [Chitinophagaceae bacterium]